MAREDSIPIFSGVVVQIKEDCVELRLPFSPLQAFFSETCFFVKTDGSIKIEVVPGGAAFLINTGGDSTEVQVLRDGGEEKLSLYAGQIARIELSSFDFRVRRGG